MLTFILILAVIIIIIIVILLLLFVNSKHKKTIEHYKINTGEKNTYLEIINDIIDSNTNDIYELKYNILQIQRYLRWMSEVLNNTEKDEMKKKIQLMEKRLKLIKHRKFLIDMNILTIASQIESLKKELNNFANDIDKVDKHLLKNLAKSNYEEEIFKLDDITAKLYYYNILIKQLKKIISIKLDNINNQVIDDTLNEYKVELKKIKKDFKDIENKINRLEIYII
jgi:hypothetical protein